MKAEHGISVIIPCLNEADSIGQVVAIAKAGIAKTALPGEVIVVDNGSSDNSAAIAAEQGARVITEKEKGYGAALRKGFANAKYDIMVMGDGDLTYDFTKLDDLVQPILSGEAEFVVGNRMKNIRPGSMPALHRYVGNPVLSMILRIMFRRHMVRDAHCGMRAIKRDAYRKLKCVTTGMEFASEMVVKAIHNDIAMTERDIVYHPRVGESKLMSFRDGWRHLRFMLLHSPATTLLLPGIVAWFVGMAMVIPLAFGPIVMGNRNVDIHFMIMGGILNIVSIQLITIGLLAKAYAHLSGLQDDPLIAWFYRHLTFERLILFTLPFILAGIIVIAKVFLKWVSEGFGALEQARVLFLGMICLTNAVQVAAAGYLFSIMILPRHVEPTPDELKSEEE